MPLKQWWHPPPPRSDPGRPDMRALLQFTLDLFDVPAVDAPRATEPKLDAPVSGPHRPAVPLGDALGPARFIHPRASRELLLGNARVAFEFTRGKRRTIGFVVGAEGLSVRAPRWVALRDVDAAVVEKSDWI